jgi:hypothetical protein
MLDRNTMEITPLETHYDVNGNQTNHSSLKAADGVRIPLTLLPNTIQKNLIWRTERQPSFLTGMTK